MAQYFVVVDDIGGGGSQKLMQLIMSNQVARHKNCRSVVDSQNVPRARKKSLVW